MVYFFILGRNPSLSAAEISSLGESGRLNKESLRIKGASGEVLLVEAVKLGPEFLDSLGGTIKMGEILDKFGTLDSASDFIAEFAADRAPGEKKFNFGISLHNFGKGAARLSKEAKALGMRIKKSLSEKGIRSRLVSSRKHFLSSVIVENNGLLQERGGLEIVILVAKEGFYVGRTVSVQKFKQYGLRDYGRPGRDSRSGMLPPKLARIMVNLARVPKNGTVLDPFCGSGTVLQEAALLGYGSLMGADNSPKAVKDSEENMGWLAEEFEIKGLDFRITEADARKIGEKTPENSIDAIVTEPYLGPPLRGGEPLKRIREITGDLSGLYVGALEEFRKVLKPGGRIVMVWPAFATGRGTEFLPIADKVRNMGYRIENMVPEKLRRNADMAATARGTLLYSRPGQHILREIVVLSEK